MDLGSHFKRMLQEHLERYEAEVARLGVRPGGERRSYNVTNRQMDLLRAIHESVDESEFIFTQTLSDGSSLIGGPSPISLDADNSDFLLLDREARERARQQHVYDILASLRDANDPETVRAYRDEIEKRGFQVLNTGEAIRAVYAPEREEVAS